MSYQVQAPVALILFNRPAVTARVFEAIAAARPSTLLVIGDGARPDRSGEAERVAAARAVVERVDWPCEVVTNYSDTNLGCKARLSSGISWVFSQVPRCIILEDDCLPHETFFRFCDDLLDRYESDRRVFHINGVNFQGGHRASDDSYYFSRLCHVWGWASWANRWNAVYDARLSAWPRIRADGRLAEIVGGKRQAEFWGPILDRVHRGEIDTWDYQWAFATMLNGGLAITPHKNLVANVGFGADATHTTGESEFANVPVEAMEFPLRHPPAVRADTRLDERFFRRFWSGALIDRVARRLRRARHGRGSSAL